MWIPEGQPIAPDTLGALVPTEVLFEYEEPLTYVSEDPGGGLLLLHSLCDEPGTSRYLVVATDARQVGDLKAGRVDLLGAFARPRTWIVDFGRDAVITALWAIPFERVPKHCLPAAGVMLTPELEYPGRDGSADTSGVILPHRR